MKSEQTLLHLEHHRGVEYVPGSAIAVVERDLALDEIWLLLP